MPGLLVIDDDRSVVHFIRSACKELAITVGSAEDAEEGLALLKRTQPDALLLDVMLPGMTGLEHHDLRRDAVKFPVLDAPQDPVDVVAADVRDLEALRAAMEGVEVVVSAIQGFAEVIQQQTVGPVPHEYRALAAAIA